jgi:Fanconi-associated nuclease 1
MPLDIDSDDFYLNRKEAIDAHLKAIEVWSDGDLREFLVDRWNENYGSVSGVSWELFRSFDHFFGLVTCFKRCQLRGMVERVLKKHRHTRSGFPDLTVWNPASRSVKIIEVKGPNDRLSTKQILWLGYEQQSV